MLKSYNRGGLAVDSVRNMQKVSISEKLTLVREYCRPGVIAELNGQQVRVARMNGPFVWHSHQEEDELLLVVDGTLEVNLLAQTLRLEAGELVVIPRGVPHQTVALGEVHLLMFAPASTVNTGNVTNELTVSVPERL